MTLEQRIKRNVEEMQTELGDDYWRASAAELTLVPAIEAALAEHAEGRLLDAGAGNLLYRPILEDHCDAYESLDVSREAGIDHVQDVQNMELPSDRYDTVFCRHVLEHVPYPGRAMTELHRVLKPGGVAIVTVPHLAYLHNEPHDYYRFTEHGVRTLLGEAEFDEVTVEPVGGFCSFAGYSLATLVHGLTYHLPVVSTAAFAANAPLQRALVAADDLTGNERYFPFNYLAIARK